tara:strand:+ start:1717 stop:1995 length:279 start_codon:yes stop_codon:yes gene_type:complete
MKTANQILSELGIEASHSREGTQNTRCPKCSHTRKKKQAKCLKVKIDQDGVRWFCHHCQDNGGMYYHSEAKYETKAERKILTSGQMRGLRNA